ncbi:hypothetical protein D8Y20_12895 [Mariprofundus sp. EBB-1]|nr:hypothetical protein D8Y20_12895 [Mariprofundus sp. EBB-1]
MAMMKTFFLIAIFVCALSALTAQAAGGLSVDARFDLTGDGIVDASDWVKMTEDAKQGYAHASIKALGEDPDALLDARQSRADRFLIGLRAVYE